MRELLAITKALADANRTRVVLFLGGREMCVCQIVEMLHLAPSTVSKHLDILCRAGLIESRKDGRWVYYRLPDSPTAAVQGAMDWVRAAAAKDPQTVADGKHSKTVVKMDKEQLCCRYK